MVSTLIVQLITDIALVLFRAPSCLPVRPATPPPTLPHAASNPPAPHTHTYTHPAPPCWPPHSARSPIIGVRGVSAAWSCVIAACELHGMGVSIAWEGHGRGVIAA